MKNFHNFQYLTYSNWFLIGLVCLCVSIPQPSLYSQHITTGDTTSHLKPYMVTATGLVVYTCGMAALGSAWYKNNLSKSFRFFNDNGEWLQVDKAGHVFSAYNEARLVSYLYQSAGVKYNKSVWLGIGAGMLAQTSIEVFDGFSDKWGFSWGDIIANVAGLSIYGTQALWWKEQRILVKVSSDLRTYPHENVAPSDQQPSITPDDLSRRAYDLYGSGLATRFLKDYNAQTNWLSINPRSFSSASDGWWPQWLNIAIGYSAENMYGGYYNRWTHNGYIYNLDEKNYPRYRQYIWSLDVDFSRIPVKSRWLKVLFQTINIIKIPAPALEFNKIDGLKAHWMYF